jgi:hypothetical protein
VSAYIEYQGENDEVPSYMSVYRDWDATYRLYRDLLGFSEIAPPMIVPNETGVPIDGKTLDDICHTKATSVRYGDVEIARGRVSRTSRTALPPVRCSQSAPASFRR